MKLKTQAAMAVFVWWHQQWTISLKIHVNSVLVWFCHYKNTYETDNISQYDFGLN